MKILKDIIVKFICICATVGIFFLFFGWGILTAVRNFADSGRYAEAFGLAATVIVPVILFFVIKSAIKKRKNK